MDYFYWLCQSRALFWERGHEFPHAFAHDVHCKSLVVVIHADLKRFVAGVLPAVRRGQDGERAEERKLTRRFYANLLFEREASCLSGSFRLPALRALALSGRTQYLPLRWVRKIIFNILSKRTGVVHTRCTSLVRPWMGYAPKSLLSHINNKMRI